MSNGFEQISIEDFEGIDDSKRRDAILFRYIHDVHIRIERLEKRRWFNTVVVGAGSVLGGAAVMLAKVTFWA